VADIFIKELIAMKFLKFRKQPDMTKKEVIAEREC